MLRIHGNVANKCIDKIYITRSSSSSLSSSTSISSRNNVRSGKVSIILPAQRRQLSAGSGFFSRLRQQLSNPRDAFANTQQIEAAIDSGNSSRTVDYIRALAKVNPSSAIRTIEKGWEAGKVPVSEEVLREYFKSVSALKKFDSINITALLEMLHKANVFGTEAVLSQFKNGASVGGMGMGMGGGFASLGRMTSAGNNPAEPLYIATSEPSWKHHAWKLARTAVGAFFLFSFVGALFDEKGLAGGSGGLGSRLGIPGSNVHQAEHSDKTFADVVGIDEAKGELEEIVMYLKDPKRFTRLGGRLPKGVLLTGPPGTGKTLLARAIAGEAGVPFFFTSGSEFEEMYVGVGARRVRDLFEQAKAKSPCIIFIDEVDAIGGKRNMKDQSAMKMTLNQLLVEMDGFEQNTGVIVIAATNFPDSLDGALLRPGRLDKHVDVPTPDIGGRKAILELYGKKIPLGPDVNLEQLARGTPGFSGAELFNLINQAAIKASVDGLKNVGMAAMEYAKDKIMMGAERKSAIISPETMRMTAYHEAGHALVALVTDGSDPIHKATIMPRGRALGMVMQLPDGDQTSMSRKQMLARLDVCMGGRVAEELVYGAENVTSGASSDIQMATRLASAMVTKYGLSDKVGVMFVDDKNKGSGETQKFVDDEIRTLLTESYARAKKVLETHRKDLDLVAKGLIDYESLSGGEIVQLLKGVQPNAKGLRSQAPSRETKPLPARVGSNGTGNASGSGNAGNVVGTKPVSAIPSIVAPPSTSSSSTQIQSQTQSKGNAPSSAAATSSATAARGPPKA